MTRSTAVFVAALIAAGAADRLGAHCPDGTPPPCAAARAERARPGANSLAVLYFDNLSRDSSDAYLADGLTEEIILRLQQVRRLEVKSRFESQRVRNQHGLGPAALGRELAARYLVNGTIQRAGDRLVVRVELTRADRGVGVWSQRFDKTSASVLDVIDDVARGVATGVAGELLPTEAADLARRPTADATAYSHYVRGNVYLAQRTPTALARAVDEYEAAYRLDPRLTVAPGRVAYAYALGLSYGVGELSAETVLARGARAVERAKSVAPGVADTWMAVGFRQYKQTGRGAGDSLDAALRSLGRATELDPGSAEAHHQYAQSLAFQERDSAALAEYRRALALEPGRAVTYQEIAYLLLTEERYQDAIGWCDSALAADPQLPRGYLVRGRTWLLLGDAIAAERDVASALAIARGGDALDAHGLQVMVLASRGDTAGARREAASAGPGTYFGLEWPIAVGQPDRALDAVEGLASSALRCYYLHRIPSLATLRGQPRYDRLVAACPTRGA
jgi:adenylate cyclase